MTRRFTVEDINTNISASAQSIEDSIIIKKKKKNPAAKSGTVRIIAAVIGAVIGFFAVYFVIHLITFDNGFQTDTAYVFVSEENNYTETIIFNKDKTVTQSVIQNGQHREEYEKANNANWKRSGNRISIKLEDGLSQVIQIKGDTLIVYASGMEIIFRR
jgi:hypothetical protein